MDEFYWKKIPKTSEKNYISRWESLNIPRKNDMADWHPMTYLKTDDEREEIQTYTLDETIGNTGIEHIEIRFPQKAKVYISDYVRAVIDLIVTSDFFMIKTLFGCREDFFSEEQEKELFKRLMKILKNNHKEGEKIKYFLENEFPAWYYKEIGYLEDVGSLEEKTSLTHKNILEDMDDDSLEKILKKKLVTLNVRRNVRDFYDLAYYLEKKPQLFTLDMLESLKVVMDYINFEDLSALLDVDFKRSRLKGIRGEKIVYETYQRLEKLMVERLEKGINI